MNRALTPLQAFNSMSKFLDAYYKKTDSDDLAVLLSSMEFLEDNVTVDAATWNDWMRILGSSQSITESQAFKAMIQYVALYTDLMGSDDLLLLLHKIKDAELSKSEEPMMHYWLTCVHNAVQEPEGSRSYLRLTK